MKNFLTCFSAAILCFSTITIAAEPATRPATASVSADQPRPTNPHSDQQSLDRFADDRLGIMFHWGPAVLRNNEISWSMSNRAKYESVYKDFNPKHFDPDQWAALGNTLGAKYMTYVCKHHDGFCMWDTKTTDNNVMNTPFKRDVVAELSAACDRHGLMFGTYLSIMDIHEDKWDRCYAARTPMPGYPAGIPHITDFTARQTNELLTKYHSQMMWYDGGWLAGWRQSDGPATVEAVIRKDNPKALITRLGDGVDDYECMEARIGTYRSVPWEMVTSVAYPTYSYNTHIKYKPASYFIETFSRVVCGNGNLLLNFVPDADGAFPPEQQKIAADIGKWTRANAKAIFGTRGGPYYPNTWGGSTRKDERIFIFALPEAPELLALPACGAAVQRANLLSGADVTFRQTGAGIELSIPQAIRDPAVTVIELTMDRPVTHMVQASRPKTPVKIKQNAVPAPIEERSIPTTSPAK
jgi:alpha-L-fucosidase